MPARPRAFHAIVDQIRDDIIQGRRRPGDRLPPEQVLAQQFKLSRSGVREALRVLEFQGLVDVRHGYAGGVFVAKQGLTHVLRALNMSLQLGQLEVDELYEARILIEPTIIRLAVQHADDAIMQQLEANIQRAKDLIASGRDAFATNLEFHAVLAQASGNRVLALVMQALVELLDGLDRQYPTNRRVSRKAVDDHTDLIQAMRTRKPDRAEQLMSKHLRELEGRFARIQKRLLQKRAAHQDAIPPWGGLRIGG